MQPTATVLLLLLVLCHHVHPVRPLQVRPRSATLWHLKTHARKHGPRRVVRVNDVAIHGELVVLHLQERHELDRQLRQPAGRGGRQ